MPFLTDDATSATQTSVCLQSLFSFLYPRPFVWFWFLLGSLWEGWRIVPPLPQRFEPTANRTQEPDRDKNTLMMLPKLVLNMWLPLGPNEVCRVNSHLAGHRDEDSASLLATLLPLPTHTGMGTGTGTGLLLAGLTPVGLLPAGSSSGEGSKSWCYLPFVWMTARVSIVWAAASVSLQTSSVHPSIRLSESPSIYPAVWNHLPKTQNSACHSPALWSFRLAQV